MVESSFFRNTEVLEEQDVVLWENIQGIPDYILTPTVPSANIPDIWTVVEWTAEQWSLWDTDNTNKLSLVWGEDDTVDRQLSLLVEGDSRTLTVSGDSDIDQDVTITGSPTFNVVTAAQVITPAVQSNSNMQILSQTDLSIQSGTNGLLQITSVLNDLNLTSTKGLVTGDINLSALNGGDINISAIGGGTVTIAGGISFDGNLDMLGNSISNATGLISQWTNDSGYLTTISGEDHSTLNNLPWGDSGHYIDVDFDMLGSDIVNVDAIGGVLGAAVSFTGAVDTVGDLDVGGGLSVDSIGDNGSGAVDFISPITQSITETGTGALFSFNQFSNTFNDSNYTDGLLYSNSLLISGTAQGTAIASALFTTNYNSSGNFTNMNLMTSTFKVDSSASGNLTNVYNIRAANSYGAGGAANITNWYMMATDAPMAGISANTTNMYGLYINSINGASTINRAIHTAGGDHYYAGESTFDSDILLNGIMNISGAGTFTTTSDGLNFFGTSGEYKMGFDNTGGTGRIRSNIVAGFSSPIWRHTFSYSLSASPNTLVDIISFGADKVVYAYGDIDLTGDLDVGGDIDLSGDLILNSNTLRWGNATSQYTQLASGNIECRESDDSLIWHWSTNGIYIPDNKFTYYGDGSDLSMRFNGTNFVAEGSTSMKFIINGPILETTGGRIVNETRVTASTYTILATDHALFFNTDSNAITPTLPAGVAGTEYIIKNTGTSGNQVALTPNGAENLLGANSAFTLNDGETLIIHYNATDGWY